MTYYHLDTCLEMEAVLKEVRPILESRKDEYEAMHANITSGSYGEFWEEIQALEGLITRIDMLFNREPL